MVNENYLSDFYVNEFRKFLDNIHDKYEESHLYLTFDELLDVRENLIVTLKNYEQSFLKENLEFDYEHPYPDPDTIYHINLDRLSFLSKLIYHKHFSFVFYKQLHIFNKELLKESSLKMDKIISIIKRNPKISYIDILKTDIHLKVALDMLIENRTIYRAGKNTNTYWKINIQ